MFPGSQITHCLLNMQRQVVTGAEFDSLDDLKETVKHVAGPPSSSTFFLPRLEPHRHPNDPCVPVPYVCMEGVCGERR